MNKLNEKTTHLRKRLRWLRTNYPLACSLKVHLVPPSVLNAEHGEGYSGDSDYDKESNHGEIRLTNDLSLREITFHLLHEYAHIVADSTGASKGDEEHCVNWGCVYAMIYTKFHESRVK